MLRTGNQYRESIRDGRAVWIDGERVKDVTEDRRRLLAYARDLLNSDYAGHRLTFELFAQSPPFAHLNAVFNSFDFSSRLGFVRQAAALSDRVMAQ
jgi:aromatic ring hydroxylase